MKFKIFIFNLIFGVLGFVMIAADAANMTITPIIATLNIIIAAVLFDKEWISEN